MIMPSHHKITRRDFMGGVALGSVAGTMMSPLEAAAHMAKQTGVPLKTSSPYPPGLSGMRGSHVGSFEVAHGVAREGITWPRPDRQTDDTYDLIIVGGGVSGLSAALMYRDRTGPDARILILDNHDDFGGHAKRNEFDVDGENLIGHGGSQTIEGPSDYSPVASQLLKDISIDVQDFYKHFDQDFYNNRNLEGGIYFNKNAYGVDKTVPDPFRNSYFAKSQAPAEDIVGTFPIQPATRAALVSLINSGTDYLPNMSDREKINLLRKTSYVDFLETYAGIPKEGSELLRDKFSGYWGIGWDALSALEGRRLGMAGTNAFGLSDKQIGNDGSDEPYIFHFPDGNAGVARSLVRKLLPQAVPGTTMQDLVTSRVDYGALDQEGSHVRIRLNSTGVDVRHAKDGKSVDVTYVQDGRAHRVRAKHTILACYNKIIPHICPEVPDAQREAIKYAEKVPLVYINVALRNWQAFDKIGFDRIFIPKAELMHSFNLDFPVSMGDYRFSAGPDNPIVVHGTMVPGVPDKGLTAREQHVAGRQRLYELSFQDFENDVFQKMDGALSAGGFDAGRDIAGITVNRWPHGYAYEYNELSDPVDWGPENGPHIAGRAQIGRISIANSDASAYAYIDGAIDAADRAVNEQVSQD
jgi:spermidine dehydrogenase